MYEYPNRLKIEHTSACNSQCIMCSHYFSCNENVKIMNDRLEERIYPLLQNVKKILLQGSGEPLLHPNIIKYINHYADLRIEVTCNTNMSIMSPELAKAIGRAFKKISVSCDGSTAEVFEGIRKGLSFEAFKSNCSLLRRICPDLMIKMYTVILRQNIIQLPDIVELAAKLGCNSVVLTDLNPKEILNNNKDMVRHYPSAIKHYLQEALNVAKVCNIQIEYPEYLLSLKELGTIQEDMKRMGQYPMFPSDEFQEILKRFYKSLGLQTYSVRADLSKFVRKSGYHCKGICNYLLDEPYINASGDVFPCCANGQYNIGNIYENTFEEIWNNEYYQRLRDLFIRGELPQYCKGCLYIRNHFLDDVEVLDIDEQFYEQQYNTDMKELVKKFKEYSERIK